MTIPYSGPLTIDFDITLECNQNCLHCNVSGGEPLQNELSKEEIFSVLQELHDIGIIEISITGGEPLMRKDWLELVEFAAKYNDWNIILNTNGILWKEKEIERFAITCKNVLVAVSIDGWNSETYSLLRPNQSLGTSNGHFERIVNNILLMKQYGIKVSGNFTITRLNIPYFFNMIPFAEGIGLDALLGLKLFPHGRANENYSVLNPTYKDWQKFLIQVVNIKSISGSYSRKVYISVMCPWEFFLPLKTIGMGSKEIADMFSYVSPLNNYFYRQVRTLGCNAGVTSCAISPDGEVFPCGTVSTKAPGLECGNVKPAGIEHVWNNSERLKAIRELKLEDIDGPCLDCEFSSICGGGCRARAYTRTGNYTALDPDCPIVHQWLKKYGSNKK